MRQAVIVSYARTGLAKAGRGGFNNTSNMTILGHAIEHAVKRSGVDPAEVEDVIAGCVAASGNVAETDYHLKTQAKQFWEFLSMVQEIRRGVRKARDQSAT